MLFHLLLAELAIVAMLGPHAVQTQARPAREEGKGTLVVVQDYKDGVSGLRAASAGVRLSVGRDPGTDGPVLFVDYPEPTGNPAGRDVRCDAENHDWTGGRAISFQVKPSHALRMSLSFLDKNGVAYTTWIELEGGVWQPVRVAFDEIRPNPYFQPPGAKLGAPIDVSDVKWIAFAPQDRTSGQLAIGRIVLLP